MRDPTRVQPGTAPALRRRTGTSLALAAGVSRSSGKGALRVGGIAVAVLAVLVRLTHAEDPATDPAREALALCHRAEELPAEERPARFDEGLALAERAIEEHPDDPVAHFAAFCNRGRRLRLEGLSFRVFGEIRRVRHHIDRTLELFPDWPDAIAGKGAMLLALPRAFGGSRSEGERLLRRALALDPGNREVKRLLDEAGMDVPAGNAVAHVDTVE
jgi:hypothetical protein